MRVTRVYHAGRSEGHRARDRALAKLGVDITLIVPKIWTEGGGGSICDETFTVIELDVARSGDVNRHIYRDRSELADAILASRPDLLDVHEEPFSAVMRQVLRTVPRSLPVVGYAAQNVDKRYPPPFTRWEREAYARLVAVYPCSRQAAAVLRRRGYTGMVEVIDLGHDPGLFRPGTQVHSDPWQIALVGRLVPEKGIYDALLAVRALNECRPARLVFAGSGPLAERIPDWAAELGIPDLVEVRNWLSPADVAELYRCSHAVLVPSSSTTRWAEQYGRMIVEAQAAGAVVLGYASGSIGQVCAGAGLLAAEGDITGLSRALVDVASKPTLWDELRNRGLSSSTRARWERLAQSQLWFYERAQSRLAVPPVARQSATEFGQPSQLRGVQRPFALPLLRDARWLARAAAAAERHKSAT